jgi:hypothetical protein
MPFGGRQRSSGCQALCSGVKYPLRARRRDKLGANNRLTSQTDIVTIGGTRGLMGEIDKHLKRHHLFSLTLMDGPAAPLS